MVSEAPRFRQSIVLPPAILKARDNCGCRVRLGAPVAIWQGRPVGRHSNGNPSGMKSGAYRKLKIGTGAATVYAAAQKRERAWQSF